MSQRASRLHLRRTPPPPPPLLVHFSLGRVGGATARRPLAAHAATQLGAVIVLPLTGAFPLLYFATRVLGSPLELRLSPHLRAETPSPGCSATPERLWAW